MHAFNHSLSGLDPKQLAAYLEALFLRQMREGDDDDGGDNGEGKFGRVPDSPDPNSLIGKRPQHGPGGERPRRHPLLSRTSRFSGIDPKLTAIPAENAAARDLFPELRLQNQLRKQLGKSSAPTLSR